MAQYYSLKTIIHSTIHTRNKTVDEIADEIGVASSTLSRYALEGESGSEMPVSRMIPLMKATRDYRLLKHICSVLGFACVKVPNVAINKKDEIDIIDDYQTATAVSVKLLKDFFNNPNATTYSKAKDSLQLVMESCASNSKYIDKKLSSQLDLEL
jgi:hypothetical protein